MNPVVFVYTPDGEKKVVAFGETTDSGVPSRDFILSLLKNNPEYRKENVYLWYANTSFLIYSEKES